ncbi:MAG: hypothetical protein PHT90_01205 [Bacilli bacterium]|nr:hypothetical protein [Bacilli bacterium]MDD2681557.1 hypothetical protein [Bacilli bacterium]MDD3121194.1 hypothetical protein [Bacilli bacterium]MDD4482562.1 hypothetical protein [Bacilli bacterium]
MAKETNLRSWILNFNNEMYSSKDVETQIEAGWYDWFCKDTSLANKTTKMGNIVKQIKRCWKDKPRYNLC